MEQQNPKVSIVVPVYNVEKYLRQCLDSIVGQTLKDIEIIIVNDGSTDSSLQIIKEYENKDIRIKIIDKKNEGYGKTVNKGLDIARGEYIGIIESDDWIEPNMFEKLYSTAKLHNVDIVRSSYYEYYSEASKDKNKVALWAIPHKDDLNKIILPLDRYDVFFRGQQVWSYVYKRVFLNENKIRFLETPGASYQDISFNFKTLSLAKSAYILKDTFVHYRLDNINSSINSKGKVFCVCEEFNEISKFLNNHPIIKSKIKMVANRSKFGSYRWNFYRLQGKERESFAKIVQSELKYDLKNGNFDKSLYTRSEYKDYKYLTNYGNKFYKAWYYFLRMLRSFFSIFFHVSTNSNAKRVFVLGIRVYKRKIL
ncbi:MAG: glycosyltransferase [Endomicrobium sp.]|jgi:glycosyltransferase involved in cell wall biosynthesis|nr:glycosyltransferase [Endomicrobium sp.]